MRLKNLTTITAACLAAGTLAQLLLPALARATPRQCIPIAYVLSNDAQNWKIGDLLCAGDEIRLRGSQPLVVQCFGVGPVNIFNGKIPSSGCGTPRESGAWSPSGGPNLTIAPRGSTGAVLQILEPSRITSTRPRLRWQNVPGATSYRIWVFSSIGSVLWSLETKKAQLSYPSNQPSLRPGSAYRIVVVAYQGGTQLRSGEQAVNVPRAGSPVLKATQTSQIQNRSLASSIDVPLF